MLSEAKYLLFLMEDKRKQILRLHSGRPAWGSPKGGSVPAQANSLHKR